MTKVKAEKKTKSKSKKQKKFETAAKDLSNLDSGDPVLTLRQKKFCELYSQDRQFFGNGVQSYIEAYGIDTNESGAYDSARTCAYRLLANVYICQYIDKLLELRGLNDSFVDKQLEFLITQHADPKAKIAAIREYNSLKNRIKTKKDTVNPDGTHTTEYSNLTEEELDNEIRKRKEN